MIQEKGAPRKAVRRDRSRCTRLLRYALATALMLSLLGLAMAGAPGESKGQVALAYYRSLAEDGIADAQLALGDIYRKGEGVPADLVEAYAWYYLAAQQGVEEAIKPMNEVLQALPQARWADAKRRAEDYEKRFIPPAG